MFWKKPKSTKHQIKEPLVISSRFVRSDNDQQSQTEAPKQTPLNMDMELSYISNSGYSGGHPVHIGEAIVYLHQERIVVRRGSSSDGTTVNEVILNSIPDSITTVEELIRYLKATRIAFPHFM